MKQVNFVELFKQMPSNYLVVDIDAPNFTMIDATNSNLKSLGEYKREDLVGKPLFQLFPDTEKNSYTEANWVKEALEEVIETRSVVMTTRPLRYDIPNQNGGSMEMRYWQIQCTPYFEAKNLYAIYIFGMDVTDIEKEKQKLGLIKI